MRWGWDTGKRVHCTLGDGVMTRFITSPAIKSDGNIWNAKKIDFDGNVIPLTPTVATKKIAFVGLNTGLTIIAFWSTYSSGDDYYPIGSATVGEGIVSGTTDPNYYRYYLNAGTLKNFRCSCKASTNPSGADAFTMTIYKNGDASALTATSGDPSTYEPITFADTTNSVSVSDGDYICVKVTSTCANVGAFSVYIEFHIS